MNVLGLTSTAAHHTHTVPINWMGGAILEGGCFCGKIRYIDQEAGTVELDLTVKNAAHETRVFGTATVRIPLAP